MGINKAKIRLYSAARRFKNSAGSRLQISAQNVLIVRCYEGWNFNSGNYLFTTDTK